MYVPFGNNGMMNGFKYLNDSWEVEFSTVLNVTSHSYIDSATGEDISTNRDDVSPLILMRLPVVMIFISVLLQLYSHQQRGRLF